MRIAKKYQERVYSIKKVTEADGYDFSDSEHDYAYQVCLNDGWIEPCEDTGLVLCESVKEVREFIASAKYVGVDKNGNTKRI